MNLKIIYIVGGGHSGSTLLDMLISTAEEVTSVGEVSMFNNCIYPESKERCTCDKYFSECLFWKAVRQKLNRNINIISKTSITENLKIVWNILSPLSKYFSFSLKTGDYNLLFDTIENVSDGKHKYLLDSSKDLRCLIRLIQTFGAGKIKVIHLVRDGRGYVNSYNSKRRIKLWGPGAAKVQNFFVRAQKWIIINFMTHLYLKRNNIDSIHISYDLFCQDPEKYIDKLNEKLSINIPKNYIQKVNSTTYHNISGNPMRWKKINSIKYDNLWHKELSFIKKAILTVILFPFNKIYTYKDDFTNHYMTKDFS